MGGRGKKMSVFVHAQDIKTLHARGGGVKKWHNSVHVVVECPLPYEMKFWTGGKFQIKKFKSR